MKLILSHCRFLHNRVERKGGASSPDMNAMYVMGKVV